VDFLVLSRASSSVDEPDDELTERHWSYMDRFADGMTARGPILSPDRDSWWGSMHVVSLGSVDDVRAFVDDEPYHRAGRFASHATWRFTDLLGRAMWEHVDVPDLPTYLVLSREPLGLPDEQLLMHGSLSSLDGEPAGFAAAVQLADPSVLGPAEVFAWERGGRR